MEMNLKMTANKIGSIEAIALICIVIVNQIILNVPEMIVKFCGSSGFINSIYLSFIAIIFSLLIAKLFKHFIGKDLLDICEFLAGKWLKVIVGFLYIILFSIVAGTSLKYFCEILKLQNWI